MTTLVYRYGLAAPHDGAAVVLEQMRRAHDYRVNLVLIERGRRTAARAAQDASSAELREAAARVRDCEATCEKLAGAIRAARKATRKRAETTEMRAGLTEARAAAKQARSGLSTVRARYRSQCADCRKAESELVPCPHAAPEAAQLRTQLDAIDAVAAELLKNARHYSGLYWGTYLLVERAMAASRKASLYAEDGITPHDPPMPKWRDGQVVGVQLQSTRPLSVEKALSGTDTRLGVTAPPWPEQWLAGHRAEAPTARPQGAPFDPVNPLPQPSACRPPGQRPDGTTAPPTRADGTPARWVRDRAARHGELRVRVGTDGEVARWRLDMHRPLPTDATVTWAAVHRRLRGPYAEWSLHLTLDMPTRASAREPGGGTVAVDVGWRAMPDGSLRVAAWRDDRGASGELRLSATDMRALAQPDAIQSERDRAFDTTRARLKRWLDAQDEVPQWMQEATRTLAVWRNPAKLVRLLEQWEPTERSRSIHEAIGSWALADRHLWGAEEARRAWSLRRRKDKYAVWAATMARTYDTIVIERFDLRRVAERAPVGQDKAENEVARTNRQRAALSTLRGCLVNAAAKYGATLFAVDAADSTRTCPSCGLVADRGAAEQVTLTCECGHVWDQDTDGAAPVLLARYREKPEDAKVLAGAREPAEATEGKKGDRWARAKRMGVAKQERLRAAREGATKTL